MSIKEAENFLSRGIENVFPSKEAFIKVFGGEKKLSIYLGIDPTGPTLHMGHAIPLMKLGELQRMGHQIILLMGDFTAMIGDPTDKLATRKQLSKKDVLNNLKLYKKQASTFLSFSGKNKALIKFNSKWLAKMKFSEVIELASKVTVDQMLKRDMFRERMDGGKPVYMHEFLYPLMQGFDSVVMDVDGEIGGNDQTFNMLTGRDLMKSLKNKDKFVIATKLLVDSSGKKMGKTEGNMITFADGPSDMFGKVMSWPDSMIIPGFELSTYISLEEIEKEKQFLVGGNPRDAKLRLAHAIVSIYHGTKAADKAQEEFRTAFSSGGIPGDTLTVSVNLNTPLVDILIANNIVTSKTEFHRLVSQQAVRNLILGDWVSHHDFKVASNLDLKVGKHRFIKIRVK